MSALLRQILAHPGEAFGLGLALAKGYFYKVYLPLTGRRFTAGRHFLVFGSLEVRGPGRVAFGENVSIHQKVTPYTYSPGAVITVGDHTRLSGTRFGCAQRISIGRNGIIANCRIMDTDFHSLHPNRRDPEAPVRTLPVEVGENVWISTDSILLPGTRIHENSVVSVLTVCGTTYPANSVIAGNPARAVGRIPGAPPAEPRVDPGSGSATT
jgi:acetyltransferase-like isoleucine patch superfamily enzyme